jgi:lysophospholipase L1-like esterase
MEGINDIGMSGGWGMLGSDDVIPSDALTAGYSQIIERAHERGVKIVGATITPFEGSAFYSIDKELVREAANVWIRTSGRFDGVVDLDAAVRDPQHPSQWKQGYSGDHLHPNFAGVRRIVEAINGDLFVR